MGFPAGGWVTVGVTLTAGPVARPDFPAPPLFPVHADDHTAVPPSKTSVQMDNAYTDAILPVETHIDSKGGHGFGMRKENEPAGGHVNRPVARVARRAGVAQAGAVTRLDQSF